MEKKALNKNGYPVAQIEMGFTEQQNIWIKETIKLMQKNNYMYMKMAERSREKQMLWHGKYSIVKTENNALRKKIHPTTHANR